MKKRIVITGLGVVSPLGCSYESLCEGLYAGHSGVNFIDSFDTSDFLVKFAAQVKNFNPDHIDYDQKIIKRLDPFMWYGIESGIQAINQSKLIGYESLNVERVGIIIGSGIGGLNSIEEQHNILLNKGSKRISPFFIPSSIINMIAGHLAIKFGFKGPNLGIATACSTGTHAIAQAFDMIQLGYADVMLAGGAEYASTPLGMGGFAAVRALSCRNDDPTKASRPWDKNRDGFVLGDGSACLVLEEYEHALKRGAPILAEILGGGYSADAFHMTQPHPDGEGAALAMSQSLKRANIAPEQIDYINAHGTSTPLGDLLELKAIKKVFGDHSKNLLISSTKSMTGHLLGAAGALEAVISVMTILEQKIPPTINLDHPEEDAADFNLVPHHAIKHPVSTVLSNSFGFGGTNGSLIFKKI